MTYVALRLEGTGKITLSEVGGLTRFPLPLPVGPDVAVVQLEFLNTCFFTQEATFFLCLSDQTGYMPCSILILPRAALLNVDD